MRSHILLLLLAVACNPPPVVTAGDVPQEDTAAYALVGVNDLLTVRVVGEESLSGDYRVSAEGTITFPWLKDIAVAGLQPGEIQEKIAQGLRDGYVRDPQVIVDVKESNSKKIYIFGKVKSPGTIRYKDHMTILEAVTVAGGPAEDGDVNKTTITRNQGGNELVYTVRVKDIVAGKARNVELLPGDIVNVPQSW
jgi:protein involved in polysaccharide export with SLBB domain